MTYNIKPSGFKSALALLSIYRVKLLVPEQFSYVAAVSWYGVAGALVALPGFFAVMFTQWTLSPNTLAMVVLASSVIMTRMMHWDGLADVADAWWGGNTPERRREIMSDSNTGSFALITVALVVLALFGALTNLIAAQQFLVLLIVPMVSRVTASFATTRIAPAKTEGLGASVYGDGSQPSEWVLVLTVFLVCACSLMTAGLSGLAAAVLTCAGGYLIARKTSERMGGMTGDVLGAAIVLTELLGYCLFVLVG